MSLLVVGLVAAFLAVAVALMLFQESFQERRAVYRGLRTVRSIELGTDVSDHQVAQPVTRRVLIPGIRRVGRLARRLTPAGVVDRLADDLRYAGSPPGWDAERVLAFKLLLPAAMIGGVVVLGTVVGADIIQIIAASALLLFVGYYAPEWILRSQASRRQRIIQRALPDALDLLTITVQAGLGFDTALDRVSSEMGGPLGEELHRVVQEIQLGQSRVDAMRGLGERNDVPELKSFVVAMVQADILGVSISNVLKVQAREMRTKRRQRAEEQAQKLPVKLVFPLILCIFPALFVVLLGPAVLRIKDTIFQVF